VARTVLVADDSPTHQRRANGILTGEGLEVVTVSNGVAAIKKLSTFKPALVLADVSMPGRDGYEVCEFVKNSPELAQVPVLLIVSDLEPYDEARAQRARANGRIKKPFGQDELVAVVNRFIAPVEAAPPPAPVAAAAPRAYVTEPVDLPPELAAHEELPDLSKLSQDMAFGEPAMEAAAPAPEAPPPMMAEEAVPPQFPPPEVPAALEFPPAAESPATREMVVPPFMTGLVSEAVAEAPVVPLMAGTGSEEATKAPEIFEAPAPVEEPATAVEPVFVEEPIEPESPPAQETPARTMIFRMPVQIAEPMLADDLASSPAVVEEAAPPAAEAPVAEEVAPEATAPSEAIAEEAIEAVPPEIPIPVEPPLPVEAPPLPPPEAIEEAPVAAAPQPEEAVVPVEEPPAPAVEEVPVAAAPQPEEAVAPAEEPPAPAVEEAPAAAPEPTPEVAAAAVTAVDTDLIYWIVHNVVVRMAPPALETRTVEELIRSITDEMINELTQPPPQPQG